MKDRTSTPDRRRPRLCRSRGDRMIVGETLSLFEGLEVVAAIAKVGHPAKFTPAILAVVDELLGDAVTVLDPFAGTGGIHILSPKRRTYSLEIEPEWAALHEFTVCGSALNLPWPDEFFDAVATSPTYGNRMAATYDGRDGSQRSTYRTALGRELSEGNSGSLQWGQAYRDFHTRTWVEAIRVLKPGGRFVLNCKDHYRGGVLQRVTDWHVGELGRLGLRLTDRRQVRCRGNRFGANSLLRADCEEVILLLKEEARGNPSAPPARPEPTS
jgi:hypothetical protein